MAPSTKKKPRRQLIESSSDNENLMMEETGAFIPDSPWDLDFSVTAGKVKREVDTTTLSTDNDCPPILETVYGQKIIDFEKLVIHNNKLEQAENWFLEFTAKVNKRIIVISGPAGCGKTSLFRSLCRKYDINAIDGYTIDEHHRPSHQGSRHKKTRYSYPSLAFSSLEENSISHRLSGDLIYFDDLPNMECNAIIENLLEDLEDSTFSLAFLVTDPSGGSSLNNDNLLRRILEFPKGTLINLNPIAPMFQIRMIKQLLAYEDIPLKEDLSDDLRASLLNLHMKLNFPELSSYSFSRDNSVGLFHSLGKILYSRHRKEEAVDAAKVTESNRELFQLFLHANYPKFFAGMTDIARIADIFSFTDSVPWIIYQDSQWHNTHAALPEVAISSMSSANGEGSAVRNFYSFKAPVRLPRDKFCRLEASQIEEE